MKHRVWLGSYSDTTRRGIQLLEVDGVSGAMELRYQLYDIENPTYLVLNRARNRLYTVCKLERAGSESFGAIAAYAVTGESVRLLNICHTPGTVPCHLALTPDEQALTFAEYAEANFGLVQLDESGAMAATTLVTGKLSGSGPNKSRQESAHAHFAAVTPDERWLYVCDLGSDEVRLYSYQAALAGRLEACSGQTFHARPGAGPRHLRFHPNGRFAYLLNELDNTLIALEYDGASLLALQSLSTLPDDFAGESKAAALKFADGGRLLLASNRGYNSIAAFAVNQESGRLTRLAVTPLSGPFPRDFEPLTGSDILLAGHKHINEVAAYRLDCRDGSLERLAASHSLHRPTCIVDGT